MKHIRSMSCAKHLPMKACEEGEGEGLGVDLAAEASDFINGLVCQFKPEKEKCAEA